MKSRLAERLTFGLLLPMLLHLGCATREQGVETRAQKSGEVYGKTTFVMVRNSPDGKQTVFEGGSYFQFDEKGRIISPGSALLVVDREGMKFGGVNYAYGTLLLVGEKDGELTFRVAGPGDSILLKQAVTIFGKEYPAGQLPIPLGGKMAP